MKTKIALSLILFVVAFAHPTVAQDGSQTGFVITLKNGSTIRSRTLLRDEATGKLHLTMTETSGGAPKSFAMVAMDDAESIRASAADTDSIRIKLIGGSELKCKEFGLSGDTVSVKLGSASRVEVKWEQIESITFAP
ncbi:MAG TPA: hypothetical protein VGV87_29190 [Blastocatellia bacterium]|jgi:hypothetical protein|nr:hypothetical protein [Blastocatellia bacterium]